MQTLFCCNCFSAPARTPAQPRVNNSISKAGRGWLWAYLPLPLLRPPLEVDAPVLGVGVGAVGDGQGTRGVHCQLGGPTAHLGPQQHLGALGLQAWGSKDKSGCQEREFTENISVQIRAPPSFLLVWRGSSSWR